jgi:hypothetical protein
MEQVSSLKQMESQLSITCDKVITIKAKMEDFLFRAQRIASNMKNGMGNNDMMFGYDLQGFRRVIRAFSQELSGLPGLMGSIERSAAYDDKAAKYAQSVMRLSMRLSQSLRALHDTSLLAHQHIRTADHKIEAWYLAQDVEELVMRGQGLPTSANKIVIATSTPPSNVPGSTPPAGGAPPPAAKA